MAQKMKQSLLSYTSVSFFSCTRMLYVIIPHIIVWDFLSLHPAAFSFRRFLSHTTQLNSHNSSHTTHLTQLISLHSNHLTDLTQLTAPLPLNLLHATPGAEVRAVIQCRTHGAALSYSFDPTGAQTSILHLISYNSFHTPTIIHLFLHLVSQSYIPDEHDFTCGVIRSFNLVCFFVRRWISKICSDVCVLKPSVLSLRLAGIIIKIIQLRGALVLLHLEE